VGDLFVFQEMAPRGPITPVVVSVPHAGTAYPAHDALFAHADTQGMLRDADLFVDRLYAHAPDQGAALVCASISRYVLDLNRSPRDVDLKVCPELSQPGRPNPRGLIWRLSTDGKTILPRPLTLEEVEDRIRHIHRPYHEKLRSLLEDRKQKFGFAILLDGHSMPSVGRATHSDPGTRRADIVPGNLEGRSCDARLTNLVVGHFENAGYQVECNAPYKGGFITQSFGRPSDGIHTIQIEINRDLYMDEEKTAYDDEKAGRLIPHLDALVKEATLLDLS
jgi:N-formylglutamate amidohydrolase